MSFSQSQLLYQNHQLCQMQYRPSAQPHHHAQCTGHVKQQLRLLIPGKSLEGSIVGLDQDSVWTEYLPVPVMVRSQLLPHQRLERCTIYCRLSPDSSDI